MKKTILFITLFLLTCIMTLSFSAACSAQPDDGNAPMEKPRVVRITAEDGKLVHGTNYDNEDFTIGRNGVVLIAKPQSGNAFLGMIHPGMPWPMRGMSEAGVTIGEPTSNSADNDILANPQAEPAQAGTYWPIDLKKQLSVMDALIDQGVYADAGDASSETAQQWIKNLLDAGSAN